MHRASRDISTQHTSTTFIVLPPNPHYLAGMYSDAVRCALALDLGLAKSVAGEPEGDDQLRRKLWLQVGYPE